MKKIFFSALAALSLVACVQEAVVDTPQGEAISFKNAFVDNATRADATVTTDNLTAFRVWGFINNTHGVLFDGTKVTGGGQSWSYEGTKYWIPEQDYYFAALAPVNENGVVNATVSLAEGDNAKIGLGTVTFINEGQTDLIYAQAKQTGKQSGNAAVAFTFKHLLAKVKFTFTTAMGMNDQKITAEVTNIKMTAPKEASINLAAKTPVWSDYTAEKVVLDFGNATEGTELFAIPTVAYDYLITFTVTIKQEGAEILTINKASTVNGLALEMGKAYNFTAEINPQTLNFEDIVFNVDGVEAWDNNTSNVGFAPATPVKTTRELMAAIEAGENVVLTEDIDLDNLTKAAPQPLVINKDITLDGNGHTLRSTATRAINVSGANEVTIKNVNIVAAGERAINVIQNTKKVNIKNVTATAANYTVNVAGSAPKAEVVITGSELTGLNTINIAGEYAKVEIIDSKITCNDQNDKEHYAALTINMDGENAVINMASGEIVVNGDSYAGSLGGSNSQITIAEENVNITEEAKIRIVNYFIEYGNYAYAFETFAEALEIVKNGETIKLNRNIKETIEVTSDKTFTLDLNGKTITTELESEGRHHYAILNYGNLVLTGTGAINARGIKNFGTMTINDNITITNVDANGGAAVWNEGTVTINAGTFTTSTEAGEGSYGAALNTRPGGTAVVNGGNFSAYSQLTYAIVNEGNTTINNATVVGKHGAVAGAESNDRTTINGGSFSLMENPGVSDHCAYFVSTIKGGTFTLGNNTDCGAQVFYKSTIAEGYEAVEGEKGWWTVKPDYVNTAAELTAALAAKKAEIFLEGGAEIEGTFNVNYPVIITSPADNKATIVGRVNVSSTGSINCSNIKFDVNDASTAINTYSGANYQYPAIVTIKATSATFSNCEFKNLYDERSVVAINYGDQADGKMLTVDNCDFQGYAYAIRTRALVSVTNSRFNHYHSSVNPRALWVWGLHEASTMSGEATGRVIFTGNTATNKEMLALQMPTSSYGWKNIHFNVQNNTNFSADPYLVQVVDGKFQNITFESGSATFEY